MPDDGHLGLHNEMSFEIWESSFWLVVKGAGHSASGGTWGHKSGDK